MTMTSSAAAAGMPKFPIRCVSAHRDAGWFECGMLEHLSTDGLTFAWSHRFD